MVSNQIYFSGKRIPACLLHPEKQWLVNIQKHLEPRTIQMRRTPSSLVVSRGNFRSIQTNQAG